MAATQAEEAATYLPCAIAAALELRRVLYKQNVPSKGIDLRFPA